MRGYPSRALLKTNFQFDTISPDDMAEMWKNVFFADDIKTEVTGLRTKFCLKQMNKSNVYTSYPYHETQRWQYNPVGMFSFKRKGEADDGQMDGAKTQANLEAAKGQKFTFLQNSNPNHKARPMMDGLV